MSDAELGWTLALACAAAAAISAGLIRLLRPLLARYALARPNARSSHSVPTPQGGGIAVVAAALLATGLLVMHWYGLRGLANLIVPGAAVVVLAAVGGIDDIRPLSPALRLVVQAGCVLAAVVAADPPRLLPEPVPAALERAGLVIAGVWWVNVVNFMDGIDWITCAAIVPLTAAVALFGLVGAVAPPAAIAAAALAGGLVGFAPANKPVARLFLGDVGSLPIGLMTGGMLLALASSGDLAAAVLLPLYYLADATLTLLARLTRGERVWEAHRSHFYQRALTHGWTVREVDGHVFHLNAQLALLAAVTIFWTDLATALLSLALGAFLVGARLRRMSRPRSRSV